MPAASLRRFRPSIGNGPRPPRPRTSGRSSRSWNRRKPGWTSNTIHPTIFAACCASSPKGCWRITARRAPSRRPNARSRGRPGARSRSASGRHEQGMTDSSPRSSAGAEYRAYVQAQIESLTETLTKVMFGDFTAVARTPEPDEAFGHLCAMVNVAINAARNAQDDLRRANEQLRAEAIERQRAEAAAGESRDLLQAVTDSTTACIYVKDLQGRYMMVNRRYLEVFHIGREDVIGKTDYDLFTKPMADAFRDMDLRVVAAGEALVEEEMAPHDDGPHPYLSVKSPLRDRQGEVCGVIGISTDVIETKRAEEALRE